MDYMEIAKRLRNYEWERDDDGKCLGCPDEESDYPCCVNCFSRTHLQAADAIEELFRVAKKMHLWIFLHSGDEQKAYDWCGLSDEMNAALGYSGQFELRAEPPKEEPQIISAVDCKDCRYYPPSSLNGKPCTQCDMGNPLMNCFSPKEETE